MLYACNELIRPDVVLEMSWRHGLHDFTMPYMINLLCQSTKELATLKADNEARKAKEKEKETVEDSTPILGGNRLMITAGHRPLAGSRRRRSGKQTASRLSRPVTVTRGRLRWCSSYHVSLTRRTISGFSLGATAWNSRRCTSKSYAAWQLAHAISPYLTPYTYPTT